MVWNVSSTGRTETWGQLYPSTFCGASPLAFPHGAWFPHFLLWRIVYIKWHTTLKPVKKWTSKTLNYPKACLYWSGIRGDAHRWGAAPEPQNKAPHLNPLSGREQCLVPSTDIKMSPRSLCEVVELHWFLPSKINAPLSLYVFGTFLLYTGRVTGTGGKFKTTVSQIQWFMYGSRVDISIQMKPRRYTESPTEAADLNQNHFIGDRCMIITLEHEVELDWLTLNTATPPIINRIE